MQKEAEKIVVMGLFLFLMFLGACLNTRFLIAIGWIGFLGYWIFAILREKYKYY